VVELDSDEVQVILDSISNIESVLYEDKSQGRLLLSAFDKLYKVNNPKLNTLLDSAKSDLKYNCTTLLTQKLKTIKKALSGQISEIAEGKEWTYDNGMKTYSKWPMSEQDRLDHARAIAANNERVKKTDLHESIEKQTNFQETIERVWDKLDL